MSSRFSSISEAADRLIEHFGKDIIQHRYEFRDEITLTVRRDDIPEVIRWSKAALGFDMLVNLCSVDNLGQSPRFEVVYTVTRAEKGEDLTFKVLVDDEEEVPSIVEHFRGADWNEREVWDLMGIKFKNHPDMRRILMWDEYPYHPLRKDFPVQGIPTELPGVAFTEAAPTKGAPFATIQGKCPSMGREPRSRNF